MANFRSGIQTVGIREITLIYIVPGIPLTTFNIDTHLTRLSDKLPTYHKIGVINGTNIF